MSGRGLRKVLKCSDGALKGTAACRRTFTSSSRCQKHGPVPAFAETSSPELDSILASFRSKVFLPAHLSKQQQDLIYKKKNQRLLSVEPVMARIGGEDFQLEHIDRVQDVPNSRKAFFEAVDLMKEKKDWDQVPVMLQELKNAGRSFNTPLPLILIRKAAIAGRMDVMIECVRRVEATGFRLNDPDLVAALMWGLQYKAIASKFSEKHTKKALSWAEMLLIILEEDRHACHKVLKNDPRRRLEVIGALLQLAAVRAARHLDGKDEHGMVEKYAERALVASLGQRPPLLDVEATREKTVAVETTAEEEAAEEERRAKKAIRKRAASIHDANAWLKSTVPILHGMKVAQTVLDPASQLAVQLKRKADALEATVISQQELMIKDDLPKNSTYLGLELYDQLLAPGATSA